MDEYTDDNMEEWLKLEFGVSTLILSVTQLRLSGEHPQLSTST